MNTQTVCETSENSVKGARRMKQYNLITSMNSIKPNYDVSNEYIYFEIYVSSTEEVCIIGKIDNNYICWSSITSTKEVDKNAEIFNYLLSQPKNERLYSTKYEGLSSRYEEIMKWHFFTVARHWHQDHYRYRSPVSNCFLGSPPHNNGRFLANEIQSFFRDELEKCNYRLIENVYLHVLNSYRILLKKDNSPEYYHTMIPIIEILKHETYLKLSPVDEVRALYWDCLDQCSNLYNSYMTAVR